MDKTENKLILTTQRRMYGGPIGFNPELKPYPYTADIKEKKRLAEMPSYVAIERELAEERRRKEQKRIEAFLAETKAASQTNAQQAASETPLEKEPVNRKLDMQP